MSMLLTPLLFDVDSQSVLYFKTTLSPFANVINPVSTFTGILLLNIVDADVENQFFAGKNPDTWDGGDTQGYNVSITVSTHVARKSQLKIRDDFRVGINRDNNDLPMGI